MTNNADFVDAGGRSLRQISQGREICSIAVPYFQRASVRPSFYTPKCHPLSRRAHAGRRFREPRAPACRARLSLTGPLRTGDALPHPTRKGSTAAGQRQFELRRRIWYQFRTPITGSRSHRHALAHARRPSAAPASPRLCPVSMHMHPGRDEADLPVYRHHDTDLPRPLRDERPA